MTRPDRWLTLRRSAQPNATETRLPCQKQGVALCLLCANRCRTSPKTSSKATLKWPKLQNFNVIYCPGCVFGLSSGQNFRLRLAKVAVIYCPARCAAPELHKVQPQSSRPREAGQSDGSCVTMDRPDKGNKYWNMLEQYGTYVGFSTYVTPFWMVLKGNPKETTYLDGSPILRNSCM